MFWKKIRSDEYLELLQKIETLRINMEGLKLDLDLYKKKLRVSKKLDPETDLSSPMLLPE